MPSTREFHSVAASRKIARLLLAAVLVTGTAWGQTAQNQPPKPLSGVDKDKVNEAVEKATHDDPESIYYVEQIAQARALQAIPMLEDKFVRTQDALDKAHIASALVRLGDKNDIYWNFLLRLATEAVETDAPNFTSYDSQGKSEPGPSPAFVAWANAHKLSADGLGEEHIYRIPGAVGLLALAGDPRAVPLLRRALLSSNYQIEILAAMGLAEIGDKDSVPFIIEACRRAPSEVAAVIARSLVYFDAPEAQGAVDQFIPKEAAAMYREARANGKKPLSN